MGRVVKFHAGTNANVLSLAQLCGEGLERPRRRRAAGAPRNCWQHRVSQGHECRGPRTPVVCVVPSSFGEWPENVASCGLRLRDPSQYADRPLTRISISKLQTAAIDCHFRPLPARPVSVAIFFTGSGFGGHIPERRSRSTCSRRALQDFATTLPVHICQYSRMPPS